MREQKVRINKNRGLRCPIKNSDFQDVNIISFSMEKNHPSSDAFSLKDFAYYTVRYIIDGCGWAKINGKMYKLLPDMLFVTYPNSDAAIVQDSTDPYTLAWFVCDGARVKKILHRIGISSENMILQLSPNNQLRSLFMKTPTKCKNNIANSDIIAISAFYNIMELILAQRCVPDAKDSKSAIHVNAAMQYISDNFRDSDLTALEVSRAIGIAPKYLSRIFKQQTGTDLGRYITNRRLSAATELMQKCEYSLAEISRMCGFTSPYYFSVVFKKYNKITPSMAVKEYKNKLNG